MDPLAWWRALISYDARRWFLWLREYNIGEREYEAGVCVWVVTLDSNLKDGIYVMVPNVCFIFISTLESDLD